MYADKYLDSKMDCLDDRTSDVECQTDSLGSRLNYLSKEIEYQDNNKGSLDSELAIMDN